MNLWVGGSSDRTAPTDLLSFPHIPFNTLKPQKQAFAMNVSGFHFDVTVTDMAAYDFVAELEAR